MKVLIVAIAAAAIVAGIIWHARRHEESGESALRIATRDIHEWWHR